MKKSIKLFINIIAIGLLSIISIPTAYAASGYSFSLGTNFGSGNINTTRDANAINTILGNMGYTNYKSTVPTYSVITSTFSSGRKRMESDVIFLAGHGDSSNVYFNYMGYGGNYAQTINKGDSGYCTQSYTYNGLGLWNMNNVDFIFFAACQTGYGTDNIAKSANTRGAKASLGWKVNVNDDDAYAWEQNFFNYISSGHTITQAITYANSQSYTTTGVKSVQKYGSTGTGNVLYSTGGNTQISSSIISDNNNSRNINVNINEDKEKEEILSIINKEFGINSNLDDFIIEKAEPNNEKVYDYYYVINGVKTNIVYTVMMDEKNNVTTIIDNTHGIDKDTLYSNSKSISAKLDKLTSKKIGEYKTKSLAIVEKNVNYSTDKLEIYDEFKYYDALKNKLYYMVYVKATDPIFNTSSIVSNKFEL